MTRLEKPVTRLTSAMMHGREIVVTLRPDNVVELKLLRQKTPSFKVDILTLYRWAEQASIAPIPARKK